MREFQQTLFLKRGLTQTPNDGGLTICKGLKTTELGLYADDTVIEEVLNPSYPFPKVVTTSVGALQIAQDKINDFPIHVQNDLNVIDFGGFVLITVGGELLVFQDSKLTSFLLPTLPKFSFGCNLNGQLVGGCILSDWYGMNKNSIFWSRIGSLDALVGIDNVAGFRMLNSEVKGVIKLGNQVIVYTDTTVYKLFPHNEFLGLEPLYIGKVRFFGGDEFGQLFITIDGLIWSIGKDAKIDVFNYKNHLKDYTDLKILHFNDTFLIYNKEITYSFDGASLVNLNYTPYYIDKGVLYGTTADALQHIQTLPQLFSRPGQKLMTVVEAGGEFETLYGKVYFSYDKHTYKESREFRFNKAGLIAPTIAGVLFYFDLYGKIDNLQKLVCRFKQIDKTQLRGSSYDWIGNP